MDYQIGCNYWGSRAGTEMWAQWDETSIEQDLQDMSEKCGVRCVRMFPNWRDFQPIRINYCGMGQFREYAFPNDQPIPNPDGIDPVQMEHLHTFCRFAQKYNLKLIVGLVTGWMSGRLFVPPALEGKNIITDPECLMWQNRYVRGLVGALKDEKSIIAWDLGNECNNMGSAQTRGQAYVWSMTIANAIRVCDPTRPVISGMHSLTPDGVWQLEDQGELTDILTPHPYPSVFSKRDTEPLNELTTTMYPTAQILYYSGIGGRQALIEETGTFSQMLGNNDMAADYLRMSLWSGLANGAAGTLWWCAYDQDRLTFPPYNWNMCENELGLMHSDRSLKANGQTMAEFSNAFDNLKLNQLPPRRVDACCILTREQNPLLVNLTATVMSKLAGFETIFIYHDQPLPDAPLYLLPSVNGTTAIKVTAFQALLSKVREGATLYISLDAGLLLGFESTFGATVSTRQNRRGPVRVSLETSIGTVTYTVTDGMELFLEPTTAEVLGQDENGHPIFLRNKYGQGEIYLLVDPIEKELANRPGSFCDKNMPAYYGVYHTISQKVRATKIATSSIPQVVVTEHTIDEKNMMLIAINYTGSDLPLDLELAEGWATEILYGLINGMVPHNNAVVLHASRS